MPRFGHGDANGNTSPAAFNGGEFKEAYQMEVRREKKREVKNQMGVKKEEKEMKQEPIKKEIKKEKDED